MTQIPVRLPDALTFEDDTLVRQHVAPLDAVHLGELARLRVDGGHDFQQGVAIELGFHDALDDFVELRTLNFLRLLHILDVLALLVHAGEHVAVTQYLAFERLDDGADMGILLKAGFVQVDQARPVVEDAPEQHVLTRGAVAVVALDLADVFLYGLLRGPEYALQKGPVECVVGCRHLQAVLPKE